MDERDENGMWNQANSCLCGLSETESPCDALTPPRSRWCICGRRNLGRCLTSTFPPQAADISPDFFFFPPCWGGCSEKNGKTSLNCAHPRARQSRCHVCLITVTLNSSLQAAACRALSGVMAVFVKWRQIFLHLSCTLVKCSAGYLKTKNLCNIVRINVCILNDKKSLLSRPGYLLTFVSAMMQKNPLKTTFERSLAAEPWSSHMSIRLQWAASECSHSQSKGTNPVTPI